MDDFEVDNPDSPPEHDAGSDSENNNYDPDDSDYEDVDSSEDEDDENEPDDINKNVVAIMDQLNSEEDVVNVEKEQSEPTSNLEKESSKPTSTSRFSYPTWKGERLYPPVTKFRSEAWHYGGFLKDKTGTKDTRHAICSFCGEKLPYKSSPFPLMTHLNSQHRDKLQKQDENVKESSHQSKMTDFANPGSAKVIPYKKSNPKQVQFENIIVKWIIESLRPLKIVTDKRLIEAFSLADPKLTMPTMKQIRKDILRLYDKKKLELKEELKDIAYAVSTNDAGSSYGGSSYIDINLHYITKEMKLKKKILAVVPVEHGKTATEYRQMVDKVLDEFNVKEKVHLFTTDNEPTMLSAFCALIRNGCLAHILSNGSKTALNKVKPVQGVRSSLRKVALKFNKSNKFKKTVFRKQKEEGLSEKGIEQEVDTRFTSTFNMISSILRAPKNQDVDEEIVAKNIKAINNALAEVVSKAEYKDCSISTMMREVMTELHPLLSGLEEGITLMGAEKYGTGSSVLPFLYMFNKVLEPTNYDRQYLIDVKKEMSDYLKKSVTKNLNFEILAKASYFDKRYATLSFIPDQKKDHVKSQILDELKGLEDDWKAENNLVGEPPKKKRRFLSFDIDAEVEEFDESNQADNEMKRYELEGKLTIDEDPLLWWKGRMKRYPLMIQLARKYLPVQGTSTPAERVMSKLGKILTKARMRMKSDLFNALMFLSDCDL